MCSAGVVAIKPVGNFGYGLRLDLLPDFENAITDRGMIEAIRIRQNCRSNFAA